MRSTERLSGPRVDPLWRPAVVHDGVAARTTSSRRRAGRHGGSGRVRIAAALPIALPACRPGRDGPYEDRDGEVNRTERRCDPRPTPPALPGRTRPPTAKRPALGTSPPPAPSPTRSSAGTRP